MASRSSFPGARIRGGLILIFAVWILTSFIASPRDFVTVGAPTGRSNGASLSMITRGAFKKGQIEGFPLNKDSSNDRVARGALKRVQVIEDFPPRFKSLNKESSNDQVMKGVIRAAFIAVAFYLLFQFVMNIRLEIGTFRDLLP
eukprot:CAMPEP_0180444214 /NCGR_PEP_ID=MMETSP1036_2-20121128/15071_1 /TAXON_ID=632150 /ORGANISM="Azadinium spinosum, Strain 3D9" /LENGTH=143 /DNA_ID=CAMNT_0022450543 /DNA_START=84 /DNA_END=515 /DNA_ORIENTATION=+